MKASAKLSIFAGFSVVALASSVAVLALEHFGLIHPSFDTAAPVAVPAPPAGKTLTARLSDTETTPRSEAVAPRRLQPPAATKGDLLVDAVATGSEIATEHGASDLRLIRAEEGPLPVDPAIVGEPTGRSGEETRRAAAEAVTTDAEVVEGAASELQVEEPVAWTAETHPAPAPKTERTRTALAVSIAVPPIFPKAAAPATGAHAPALPEKMYTLEQRLSEISPSAKQRLAEKFKAAGAEGKPEALGLVAIKDQKVLDLYAKSKGGAWAHIHRYPVLAASGGSGPKLKQGDKQVPEGVYGISFLNPNSKYHVAMRVSYPNDFDREMAAKDGRKELGGDIMIHGKAVSIGCLAIGDEAAEELFVLASETGIDNIKLVIAPSDFRKYGVPAAGPESGQPKWVPKLYTQVASAMGEFPAPKATGLAGLLSYFGQ